MKNKGLWISGLIFGILGLLKFFESDSAKDIVGGSAENFLEKGKQLLPDISDNTSESVTDGLKNINKEETFSFLDSLVDGAWSIFQIPYEFFARYLGYGDLVIVFAAAVLVLIWLLFYNILEKIGKIWVIGGFIKGVILFISTLLGLAVLASGVSKLGIVSPPSLSSLIPEPLKNKSGTGKRYALDVEKLRRDFYLQERAILTLSKEEAEKGMRIALPNNSALNGPGKGAETPELRYGVCITQTVPTEWWKMDLPRALFDLEIFPENRNFVIARATAEFLNFLKNFDPEDGGFQVEIRLKIDELNSLNNLAGPNACPSVHEELSSYY